MALLICFGTRVQAQISHEVQPAGTTQYTSYHANGKKKAVYYYDNTHTRTGTWQFYDSGGELEQEINHNAQGYFRKFNKGACVLDAQLEAMKFNGKAELKWEREEIRWGLSAGFANGLEQGRWQLVGVDTLDMEFVDGQPSGEWRMHKHETVLKISIRTRGNAHCEIYVDGTLKFAGFMNKQMLASGDWQVFNKGGKAKYYAAQDALAASPQYARYKQCMEEFEQAMQQLPAVFLGTKTFVTRITR